MILLAFDLETTGLDSAKDRPIEVGAILYSTSQKKCLESQGFLVQSDVPVSAEITKITGITQAAVNKFGYDSQSALMSLRDMAEEAEAWIGQNVLRFDKKFLDCWQERDQLHIPEKLWIDTMYDLPGCEAKHLGYMAADHGFLNLFPHSALSDCQTVLKLFEHYSLEQVIERAKSPLIVVQSLQDRSDNDLVKKRKFRWNPERKIWWRLIKEIDRSVFVSECLFKVKERPDLSFEELDS